MTENNLTQQHTMKGKVIILSAPSGAGKTTILKYLLHQDLDLEFSVSACNRKKRNGEEHGKDYYFLSTNEFINKINQGEFVEWEEVYKGRYYGTLKSELDRIWSKGKHVVFEVDVRGGLNLKKNFKDKALSIFIKPPSIDELKKRLLERSSESLDEISTRIEKAREEMIVAYRFDIIIVNNQLEEAKNQAYQAIYNYINQNND